MTFTNICEKTSCTRGEIELALEAVFLLEYRFNIDTRLSSGWTYSEFRQRYRARIYAEKRREDAWCTLFAHAFNLNVFCYVIAVYDV